jgi:hypothetical protein
VIPGDVEGELVLEQHERMEETAEKITENVFHACLESWFFNKKASNCGASSKIEKTFLAGHLNEPKVLDALPHFIKKYAPGAIVGKHRVYGLVMKQVGLYVSPDGVIQVKMGDASEAWKTCLVEIKTRVSINSQQNAQVHSGLYYRSFEAAHDLIEPQHRAQLIHQAAVTSVTDIFYVVSTKSSIIYSVLVTLKEDLIRAYLTIMDIVLNQVPWIKENNPVFPVLPEGGVGGCVDKETLQLNYFLVKKLRDLVIARGRPYPSASRIVPRSIVMWNHCKGMTDVFSRCLKNVKPGFKSLHPYAFIWIRLLMTMMWNSHILMRLFRVEKDVMEAKTIEGLHDLLNKEASFQQSILEAAMTYSITNVGLAINSPAAQGEVKEAPISIGSLKDTSRNATKVDFLNSPSYTTKRKTGPHIPGVLSKSRRCIFCDNKTTSHCKNCEIQGIIFPMCTSASVNESGRRNIATCFARCHSMDVIKVEHERSKPCSEKMMIANKSNSSKRGRYNREYNSANDDDDDDDDDDDGEMDVDD